jgi:hypothetical protein
VNAVLEELGVQNIPTLNVWNKVCSLVVGALVVGLYVAEGEAGVIGVC